MVSLADIFLLDDQPAVDANSGFAIVFNHVMSKDPTFISILTVYLSYLSFGWSACCRCKLWVWHRVQPCPVQWSNLNNYIDCLPISKNNMGIDIIGYHWLTDCFWMICLLCVVWITVSATQDLILCSTMSCSKELPFVSILTVSGPKNMSFEIIECHWLTAWLLDYLPAVYGITMSATRTWHCV